MQNSAEQSTSSQPLPPYSCLSMMSSAHSALSTWSSGQVKDACDIILFHAISTAQQL